ncbi:hypothetical protein [Pontibacter harenae]|uniref:hypothetical protein n=1 Tax=Pontibacter harenae TaxID=2894083 RepID=UPI001E4E316C|nr:hypothetical protein [Pontibacter harenae]MCC9166215.1 hypothetical protein [Pontibacter harenae]
MPNKISSARPQPTASVVTKKKLSDSNDDLSYWLAQSATARIDAIAYLRKQYSILKGMELQTNFLDFIKILNSCKAEYMVAGGFAVAYNGYPRYTGDIDIWINPSEANAACVLHALEEYGYNDNQITSEDLTTPGVVTQLGYPPNRIDIATGLEGVDFTACWERKKTAVIDGNTVHFISLQDLKENKKATARQQDLLDLQNLPQ